MSTESADEQPRAEIARKVVTAKRRYFLPEYGLSVDANDVADAVRKAKALKGQTEEEGDG